MLRCVCLSIFIMLIFGCYFEPGEGLKLKNGPKVGIGPGVGLSMSNSSKSRIRASFNSYKELPDNNAYAVTSDYSGNFATGYGYGFSESRDAIEKAMIVCNEARATYEVRSRCKIWAIGNKVIEDTDVID